MQTALQPPWFSVVIPLFNKERHVARAICSVLSQTYHNFDVIVVNDGSTDNSVEKLQPYLNSINLVQQENMGESSARNTGISNSSSDYIAFLDADDEWLPSFLANIAHMIEKHPGEKIYCTNYIKKLGLNSTPALPVHEQTISELDFFEIARSGTTPISASSVCLHRTLLDEVGMFPTGISLYPDLFLWTKASIRYGLIFYSQPAAIYHRDADNRVCNNSHRAITDTPFESVIRSADINGMLTGIRLQHAKQFVCHYKLLNAFKALTQFQKDNARQILQTTEPITLSQTIKKLFYRSACLAPDKLVNFLWRTLK